jgi:hypothetical protein
VRRIAPRVTRRTKLGLSPHFVRRDALSGDAAHEIRPLRRHTSEPSPSMPGLTFSVAAGANPGLVGESDLQLAV